MGLTQFKNLHRGETCVLIGNGPSLSETPLDQLAKKYITFGSNQIYRLPFTPTYYACVDREMCETIDRWPNTTCFVRAEYQDWEHGSCYPVYPIIVNGFSVDIENFVVIGGTVSYVLLQLAFYMGFTTVLMVGMDHHYPKSSKYGRYRFTAEGDDPDHFKCADGKPYFLPGKTYNPPELEGVERYFAIAQDLFTQAGRRIINLTPDTKLNVFPKDRSENWL